MNEAWPFLIQLVVFAFCIGVLGLLVGGSKERRHFRELAEREKRLSHIRVCNLKRVTAPDEVEDAHMMLGSVVIATDYFKSFATGLRNLVGGEMRSAVSLMNRARREALLRLLEQAEARGASEVWNVRFGYSNISQMRGRSGGAMQVEMLAYGTAVRRRG
ncbi:MAG: hypothetical protein CMJ83_09725 [Planctomycetes bacterium]|nr:hypothetical protein [Planctomycetota bacterium]